MERVSLCTLSCDVTGRRAGNVLSRVGLPRILDFLDPLGGLDAFVGRVPRSTVYTGILDTAHIFMMGGFVRVVLLGTACWENWTASSRPWVSRPRVDAVAHC